MPWSVGCGTGYCDNGFDASGIWLTVTEHRCSEEFEEACGGVRMPIGYERVAGEIPAVFSVASGMTPERKTEAARREKKAERS